MGTPVDMGKGGPYTYADCTSAQHRRRCSTCRYHGERFCADYAAIRGEEDKILAAETERRRATWNDRTPTPALGTETMRDVVEGRLR